MVCGCAGVCGGGGGAAAVEEGGFAGWGGCDGGWGWFAAGTEERHFGWLGGWLRGEWKRFSLRAERKFWFLV